MKTVSMQLANGNEIDNLQTFAIYGRDFRGDGKGKNNLMEKIQLFIFKPDCLIIYENFNVM